MAESHLRIRLRRILRSPLGSCRSKDQISDVVDNHHHRRQHYQLLELFSPHPHPHPFTLEQTCYSLSPDVNGRKCPPASPIKKKPRNKKKGRFTKYSGSFEEHYNGLFSSDEEYCGAAASRWRMAAVDDSLAVVKRSSDPYSDFRTSMVEMIVEKQIFAPKDLENLLHCFLSLNSYHHHKIIVQVFAEIWEALLL